MTNQQGAPEALRLADELEDSLESHDGSSLTARCQGIADDAAAELRRLHAENERLATLVEAQQPAPSAAETAADILERIAEEPPINGNNLATARVLMAAQALRDKSPTPQADSQPAPVNAWQQAIDHELVTSHLGVAGAATFEEARKAIHELIAWNVEVATNPATNGGKVLIDAARAPADSVTAPALSKGEFKQFLTDVHTAAGLVSHGKRCKALGERLGNAVMRLLAAATAPAGGVVARVLLDSAGKPMLRPQLLGEEFLADPEAFDAMYPHRAPHRIADLYATPPAQAADSVLEDAALLHYALADGGNQSMNWQDVYDDWNGEGYFIDALRAAYKQDAARKQGGA